MEFALPDDTTHPGFTPPDTNGYQPITETDDAVLKSGYWKTAIGLQQVDGLQPSDYLLELAKHNIAGDLSYADVHARLRSYYSPDERGKTAASSSRSDTGTDTDIHGTQEADVVSARIAETLDTFPFWFGTDTLEALHGRLFSGLYEGAGHFRTYDIMKAEPVLGGRSVTYATHNLIAKLLERYMDAEVERSFTYSHPLQGDDLTSFSRFTADIWHVHPFDEGNTRTTAVFVILYLRSLGYEADNELFEKHSRYYRDALVRTSYFNIRLGVEQTGSFLINFYDNLINKTAHTLDPQPLIVPQLL
ncbi:MAG: Fic family protein [Coriobacteriales bacterium]|nr:Fic family protein [Coriobacteriales bacterium]